jgi:uncharacterized lipoprotein YmbA
MNFRLLPIFGFLFLAGCNVIPPPQADATRTYVLAAPAAPAAGATAPGALRIGLRSVDLAGYLRTDDLVVRRGPNELSLNDYARWGEPLDAGIARVLRARLLADPSVASVEGPRPEPTDPRDYDVSVEILHCEGGPDAASFAARIEIATPDGRVVARRVYVAPAEAWDGRDYARLAALLSGDVAGLGGVIASALPAGM